MFYRREIDGLRALAVVPVVFFHAGFSAFSGGFVGVDVFFVISGYLITSILLEDLEQKRFSIVSFYERRARRILPALFCVMLCCLPFAWLWMPPDGLVDFSRSLGAVSLFVSNLLFWADIGYFAPAAEEKPLLHTWSLAVEEQYYLLFPLVLWLAWRYGRARLGLLMMLGVIGGLVLAEAGVRYRPDAAFYLVPFRLWELLVGSWLAVLHRHRSESDTGSTLLAGLGLVAILASIILFDRGTPFPGLSALLPVAGTALLIHAASMANGVGRLLGHPVLVGIGLISYSVYLWHQPLFALARIRSIDEPDAALYVVLSLAAFVLGWLSWRLVESPFRNRTTFSRRSIFLLSGGGILLWVVLSWIGSWKGGFPGRFPEADTDLLVTHAQRSAYVVDRQEKAQALAAFPDDGRVRVLVIGDSFSQDFINVLAESVNTTVYVAGAHFVPNACQIYTGPPELDQGVDRAPQLCADVRKHSWPLVETADVIFLAAMWEPWSAEHLPATIERISARSAARIFVVGTKHFGSVKRSALLHVPTAERAGFTRRIGADWLAINTSLAAHAGTACFIDMLQPFLVQAREPGDSGRELSGVEVEPAAVRLFDSARRLVSYDGAHLTEAGVRLAADALGEQLNAALQSGPCGAAAVQGKILSDAAPPPGA